MKKALILLIVILSVVEAFAQNQGKSKIDSLFAVLKTAKADTNKVSILNALSDKQFLLFLLFTSLV